MTPLEQFRLLVAGPGVRGLAFVEARCSRASAATTGAAGASTVDLVLRIAFNRQVPLPIATPLISRQRSTACRVPSGHAAFQRASLDATASGSPPKDK